MHPRNYRNHPSKQIDHLSRSLSYRGQRLPIVVLPDEEGDGGTIIAGHGVFLSAARLGWDEIWVAPWSTTSIEALHYLVYDNESSKDAEDDETELARILVTLLEEAQSVDELIEAGSAYTDDEWIDRVTQQQQLDLGLSDPNSETPTPDLPKVPVTKPGDVITLAEGYILVCGDSTDPDVLMVATEGREVDMMFTDPPFGVNYKGRGKHTTRTILNDADAGGGFLAFLCDFMDAAPVRPAGAVYVCYADKNVIPFRTAFDARYHYSANIIWAKTQLAGGFADYRSRHEPILYGWREGTKTSRKRVRITDRSENTVWEISKGSLADYKHPNQKPVALPRRAIRNSSRAGDLVLDPFMGSGSTMLAAYRSGRFCAGVEKDPAFCDVIVERWETLTGKKVTR